MLRLLLPLALVLFLWPDFTRIELPIGAKVTATEGFDVSFWAKTGRIDIELQDGSPQSYFIKVVSADLGKNMVMGEFESMETMYRAAPDFIPRPVAWGQYAEVPDTYFLLDEYRDMIDDMPDPTNFAYWLAKLHQRNPSPSGKFGFHMTTYPFGSAKAAPRSLAGFVANQNKC